MMGIGFTIRQVGIGDGVQFTSLPENYYRSTGQKLIDLSRPWYLDHNPYVLRNGTPEKVVELWNYPKKYEWPRIRSEDIYMSNAEIHASLFGVRHCILNRPRLYAHEGFPFDQRTNILFHPFGKSHGALPDYVIRHVVDKYSKTGQLIQVGAPGEPQIPGIPRALTPTIWDLVKLVSQCRMFIGVDSGPSWIAAAYPDVLIKKIRIKFQYGYCEPQDWVALNRNNPHSFWDDLGLFQIYNCFEEDAGFTRSYRSL